MFWILVKFILKKTTLRTGKLNQSKFLTYFQQYAATVTDTFLNYSCSQVPLTFKICTCESSIFQTYASVNYYCSVFILMWLTTGKDICTRKRFSKFHYLNILQKTKFNIYEWFAADTCIGPHVRVKSYIIGLCNVFQSVF